MLKAHVGAKCVSVRCSFFVARCSTSTARLSRAASLLAVDVREAERLRGLNPPIGCHSQVPSRKGEGEERKKERKKEKKKKTVPHSDKKTKQKEDGRKGGGLGAPVGRARSSLLISLMFYLYICIIPVINSCKVIG